MDYVRAVLAQVDADEAHRAAAGDEYLITHAPVPAGMSEVFADALESWIYENKAAARELVFRFSGWTSKRWRHEHPYADAEQA